MKALTKYRCLCDKPDYAELDSKFWFMQDKEYVVFDNNILHWSTVTTECSRCGVPLCEDCRILVGKISQDNKPVYLRGADICTTIKMDTVPLCPTCAEVVNEALCLAAN